MNEEKEEEEGISNFEWMSVFIVLCAQTSKWSAVRIIIWVQWKNKLITTTTIKAIFHLKKEINRHWNIYFSVIHIRNSKRNIY